MSDPSPASIALKETPAKSSTAMLALMALGIVFGDIGTSPLYALRECFVGPSGLSLTERNILGVVSVMLWTLVLIVCVKYVLFVMNADNRGEGGILALMALVTSLKGAFQKNHYGLFVVLGILGVALLYSDGVITPAITVLGAVEGSGRGHPAISAVYYSHFPGHFNRSVFNPIIGGPQRSAFCSGR